MSDGDCCYPVTGYSKPAMTDARLKNCPTCESPQPHLHPAMQSEGEVQPCKDLWHTDARREPVMRYEPCPMCTANRPRLCDLHYQQRAEEFMETVKQAVIDHRTPSGVKATYEELLDINRALADLTALVEGLKQQEKDGLNKAQYIMALQDVLTQLEAHRKEG